MTKQKNGFIFIVLIILGLSLFVFLNHSSNSFNIDFLASTLGPHDWVEYRCEDVNDWKSQGYSFSEYDIHGCEIVFKSIPTSTGIYIDWCVCNNYCSSGNDPCAQQFGGGYQGRCTGSGQQAECMILVPDYQGGYTQVVNTCEFADTDLLAVQGFIGPQIIDLNSFQYPVKGFCDAHPAIITDGVTRETETSNTIYDDLINGGSVTITESQTITFFYVLENNYQLPTFCEDDQALNVDTEQCIPAFGTILTCPEGFYDPGLGICAVTPGIDRFCDPTKYGLPEDTNMRLVEHTYINEFGIEKKNYTCEYTPSLNPICPENSYYIIDRQQCVEVPQTEFICDEGLDLYEPDVNTCLGQGFRWLDCPSCPEGQSCVSCDDARCESGQRCTVDYLINSTGDKECSQGIFSQLIDSCIVNNPEINTYCEHGIPDNYLCVVLEIEEEVICPTGMIQVGEFCVDEPAVKFYCQKGELSGDNNSCLIQPVKVETSLSQIIINGKSIPTWWILVGLIGLVGIAISMRKK